MKITVAPALLSWARERASLTQATLAERLDVRTEQVSDWEQTGALTFRQLENLARVTHTPLGYLFLPSPPDEPLPIRDFRTVQGQSISKPSPDLLDTLYAMQRRQAWMHDYLIEQGAEPLDYVGSATLRDDMANVAGRIRQRLELEMNWASQLPTWSDALRALRVAAQQAGILVVINGIVGNDTHRKLDVAEFRGFVLSDPYAPLVFVNGADAKAAQMFTVAHELAHVWLGQAGVFNFETMQPSNDAIEMFCNRVAAEFLIPANAFSAAWPQASQEDEPYQVLARLFKVSPLVCARRALDLGYIDRTEFLVFFAAYQEDERRKKPAAGGGDFYATQGARIGDKFANAVIQAVKEGRLLYGEAYQLTGLNGQTFERFAEKLGYKLT